MHSVTDRRTDGRTDRQTDRQSQDDANSRSHCVAVRSAKNSVVELRVNNVGYYTRNTNTEIITVKINNEI